RGVAGRGRRQRGRRHHSGARRRTVLDRHRLGPDRQAVQGPRVRQRHRGRPRRHRGREPAASLRRPDPRHEATGHCGPRQTRLSRRRGPLVVAPTSYTGVPRPNGRRLEKGHGLTTTTGDLTGALVDGPYRLQRLIANGGMASVYEAHDGRLDRTVAVKMITASEAGGFDLDAFTHEARTIARLSHPNVVAVFDQGVHEGLPYVVMEYVPGSTLRDL